jgi:hypothetical protein
VSGQTHLATLLKSIKPIKVKGEFVFITVENGQYGQFQLLNPKAMFIEEEGMTLVIAKQLAEQHGYTYESIFSCITLTVHSSLDAVGLTAAISNKLKEKGISANVIAGFYHDHIFVQTEKSEQALAALNEFNAA